MQAHQVSLEADIQTAFPVDGALASAVQTTRSPATASKRVLWLDVAKGLGIVLVVIGHALGGVIDSPAGRGVDVGRQIFVGIYIFHMPLFFMLSGLLVQRRIARSQRSFAMDLILGVAYPYFLWSIIQYTVIYAAGSLVNAPVANYWQPLLSLPLATISQFWFLYILFFLHGAALLLIPKIGGRGFLCLALGVKLIPALIVPPAMVTLFFIHISFYALGVWLGLDGVERMRRQVERKGWIMPVLVILATGAVIIAAWWTTARMGVNFHTQISANLAGVSWRLPTFPASLVAIFACLAVAMTLRGTTASWFAYLGQASMTIFVLHVMFIAGSRIILSKIVHMNDPMMLWAAGAVVGLIAPLIAHVLIQKLGIARGLGLR